MYIHVSLDQNLSQVSGIKLLKARTSVHKYPLSDKEICLMSFYLGSTTEQIKSLVDKTVTSFSVFIHVVSIWSPVMSKCFYVLQTSATPSETKRDDVKTNMSAPQIASMQ